MRYRCRLCGYTDIVLSGIIFHFEREHPEKCPWLWDSWRWGKWARYRFLKNQGLIEARRESRPKLIGVRA